MDEMHCPKCGAGLGPLLKTLKMVSCDHCGTTSLLVDAQLRVAGQSGVMHDGPSLVTLGQPFRIQRRTYRARGHARFGYGRGEWDEFWCEDDAGGTLWLSIDEGDVVLQEPLSPDRVPSEKGPYYAGMSVYAAEQAFTVTEVEQARCIALRGVFPEALAIGLTYDFANCTSESGRLLSGEGGPDGWTWFIGEWVDPFEVVGA
jgi:hypothetical protein